MGNFDVVDDLFAKLRIYQDVFKARLLLDFVGLRERSGIKLLLVAVQYDVFPSQPLDDLLIWLALPSVLREILTLLKLDDQ